MASDGHRLRESWNDALNDALLTFRTHLTSPQSASWKRIPTHNRDNSAPNNAKGRLRAAVKADARDVTIHRKTTKSGEVYRVVFELPAVDDVIDLDAWKAVLVNPELRKEWDPSIESARILEMYDPSTRIIKAKFTLGWPANPRDAVMISRTLSDSTALIDVSTSLPRSPDEPSYLRPSPPYVRSHVYLYAWCIQLLPTDTSPKRIRATCFWQHDLKTLWNIGIPVNFSQQLAAMARGLSETVKKRRTRTPMLQAYGFGVSIERLAFDYGRDALAIDYSIVTEDHEQNEAGTVVHGIDELHTLREHRQLQRSLKMILPTPDGWDIRVSTRASSDAVSQLPWTTSAWNIQGDKVIFQISHAPLPDDHSILRVKAVFEFSGVLKGIRLNGIAHTVEDGLDHDLKSSTVSNQLFQDASSVANLSVDTHGTSVSSAQSDVSERSSLSKPPLTRTESGTSIAVRGPAFDKNILARVRRNYIYFSSLLQEPEAKWKQNSEQRGVSVTQLDSIDPTLVVYKAEATFVGVGLWDLYAAVVTPGARSHWDKQYENATLLEDVNELSELWHFKTKPAWPVTSRDAVVLKTVYKAPTTVHVFSFSVDDSHLFPAIPVPEQGTIRTQVDLQGWAIEALSPTTTQLTLLEQSDPKGWSGKGGIPQQMIASVAGIGEFSIRYGGPPILTRLSGARVLNQNYDHERGVFRVEYEPSEERRIGQGEVFRSHHERKNSFDSMQSPAEGQGIIVPQPPENTTSALVECEIRCDVDNWASSLDVVIDPPPQSVSCLRRHRLSSGGGGVWLTIGHDIPFNSNERLMIIARRPPFTAGKEKGVVMVNGSRIEVDVEELPEAEVKSLAKQKRIKPVRIPLDQPPVLGVIRRRRADSETNIEFGDSSSETASISSKKSRSSAQIAQLSTSVPKIPSPLSTFFTTAFEQVSSTTQQAVAAFSPPTNIGTDVALPAGKRPFQFSLDALSFVQKYQRGGLRDNWATVVDKGLAVHRRHSPEISPVIPVHKSEKVIEGVAAGEVASIVFSYDCRRQWDDRFDSAKILEEYGADCHTAFLTWKSGFPFRDRGMYVVSTLVQETRSPLAETSTLTAGGTQSSGGSTNATYCVTASFNPDYLTAFSPSKYNPDALPIGRVFLDAWIFETLDPYTAENYAIPSTKATRLIAVDYAGSLPVAFNSMINSAIPRSLLAIETYMNGASPLPEIVMPAAGLSLEADMVIDSNEGSWTLRQDASITSLLNSEVSLDDKSFNANLLVSLAHRSTTDSPILTSPETTNRDRSLSQITPRPSRSGLASRPTSPENTRHRQRESQLSPSPSRRHRRISSVTGPIESLGHRSRSKDPIVVASPSAFSIGKDSRNNSPPDYVISDIAVDLRAYPNGYEVQTRSQLLSTNEFSQSFLLSRIHAKEINDNELPINSNIFIMPPSPLYTTSTSDEPPVRHLIRLSLPTAAYEVPTVEDPLTGEVRAAPSKPQWYTDLEREGIHGHIQVSIRPLSEEKVVDEKKLVFVNGDQVTIASEKDLQKNAPVQKRTGIISRTHESPGASELPRPLAVPIAINDVLCDKEALTLANSAEKQRESDEVVPQTVSSESGTPSESPAPLTPTEERPQILSTTSNRSFLSIFSGYQNALPPSLRFGSSTSLPIPKALSSLSPSLAHQVTEEAKAVQEPAASPRTPISSPSASVVSSARTARFSLPTLVAAILIAFLVGSLLRSLLSPADFIYVVTDLGDVPNGVTRHPDGALAQVEPGWREIKRLVELKYIAGGWDFQIAVVRRH